MKKPRLFGAFFMLNDDFLLDINNKIGHKSGFIRYK